MTDDPLAYPWSSCATHCGQREGALLTSHPAYSVQVNGKLRGLTLSIPTRDETTPADGTRIQVAFAASMSGSLVLDATSTDGSHKH